MTTLGLWTPYIDEPEMYSWYRLPADMVAECHAFVPDGSELAPLGSSAFAYLRSEAISYTDNSVSMMPVPYHNPTAHFQHTERNGLEAADAYAGGDERLMPLFVRQNLSLALYTHDAHHCGSTFRIDAPRGYARPELGSQVATEWVTALALNEFMRARGLNVAARLFQTYVTWSSTYGGATPRGRNLGIPNPQPRTIWGCIMRAADVCPPPDLATWFRYDIAVNYGEVPAVTSALTWAGYISQCQGFLGYVEHCLNQLDRVAGKPISHSLGWRQRLATMQQGLEQLRQGDRFLVELVTRELAGYGVRFQ